MATVARRFGLEMSSKEVGVSLLPELFRFGLYKPSQGRMVRQFTFFGIAVIAAFGCITLANGPMNFSGKALQVGLPLAVWLLSVWIAFRAVNFPRFADFLVSVESELEKVTWPVRQEVAQATVVVLATMFSLGFFLFVVDIVWQRLFKLVRFIEY